MFSLLLYIFSSAIPVVGYYFQKSYYRPQPLNNNMNNSGFEPTNNNVHNFVPPNNIPEDCRKKQGKESSAECEPNVPSNQFKTIPLQKLNDEDPRNFWHKIWTFLGRTVWPSVVDVTIEMMPNSLKDVLIKVFGRNFLCVERTTPLLRYLRNFFNRRSINNFKDSYELMLRCELEEEEIGLKKYNLDGIQLTREKDQRFFFPVTADMAELCNAIDENLLSQFILVPKNSGGGEELEGRIVQRVDDKIFVRIYNANSVDQSKSYCMNFQPIRKNFHLQMAALGFVDKHNLFRILIKNPNYHLIGRKITTFNVDYKLPEGDEQKVRLTYYEPACHSFDAPHSLLRHHPSNLFASLNDEQRTAVVNIVEGGHYPQPYLLYGPPGTGKTKTLTAAIEQIVRTTNIKVLVCAMSNAACDEIAERLLSVLSNAEVHRLYTTSYNLDNISKTIRPACNIDKADKEPKLINPPLKTLYGYRVIVCTLSTAGSLNCSRADSAHYRPHHFQYVFIDESASSHETMTLIPIAGLCTSKNKLHANIILSGDPKQLPPITKSKEAENLGFKITWMEHLLDKSLYKRDRATGKYNPKYITLLVRNYRSHEAILEVPNKLFYDNQLIKSGSEGETNLFLGSSILRNMHFPIVFKSVQGFCEKLEDDPSLFNKMEIDAVVAYIKVLLEPSRKNNHSVIVDQSDIGVVTPYKLQCKKISQICRNNNWQRITIGTSEAFQGKEKAVMIVSTVRAGGKYLGFVNDPQRMNVIVTRAKSLLIVIGDPFTLKLDKNWAAFIKYCLDNESLIQSNKKFKM